MTRIRTWYRNLSDQWKATLRSTWQTIVGGFLLLVLSALNVAYRWVAGDDVDPLREIAAAGRVFLLLALSTLTGLVTYVMNRGDKGAQYPPPAPPE